MYALHAERLFVLLDYLSVLGLFFGPIENMTHRLTRPALDPWLDTERVHVLAETFQVRGALPVGEPGSLRGGRNRQVARNSTLRVLVGCPCDGSAALQLANRIGENVVVAETRVLRSNFGTGSLPRSLSAGGCGLRHGFRRGGPRSRQITSGVLQATRERRSSIPACPRGAPSYMASTWGMISSFSRLRSSSVFATGTSWNGGQRSGIVSPASL